MVNPKDIARSLKANLLEIDCIDMLLSQGGDVENKITFRGKGFIRQEVDGTLTFKLFAIDFTNTSPTAHLRAMFGARPGTLYRDTDKYHLMATTIDKTVWEADNILPRASWPAEGSPVLTGTMYRLVTKFRSDGRHSVQLHYFEGMELPTVFHYDKAQGSTTDRAQFEAANTKFSVLRSEEDVTITADSETELDVAFHVRIDEALKFLTARPVQWRMLIRHHGDNGCLEIAVPPAKSTATRLDPPISRGNHGWFEDGWPLFSRYLEYVLNNAQHPSYWSHCSYHLHNACEASANSIDAWAVGISVAVEGIANRVIPPKNEAESSKLADLRRWLLDLVCENEEYKPHFRRLDGLLGSLKSLRVQDRLMPLAQSGHITEEYLKAWTRLRNRHVHPRDIDLKEMQTGDVQRLFDLINKVTVLMYQVVFYLIGYNGRFTDYGTHGYPTKDYPLAEFKFEAED